MTFATAGSVFLIGDYVFNHVVGVVTSAATLLWWLSWFLVLPLYLRRKHHAHNTESM